MLSLCLAFKREAAEQKDKVKDDKEEKKRLEAEKKEQKEREKKEQEARKKFKVSEGDWISQLNQLWHLEGVDWHSRTRFFTFLPKGRWDKQYHYMKLAPAAD